MLLDTVPENNVCTYGQTDLGFQYPSYAHLQAFYAQANEHGSRLCCEKIN